MQREIGDLSRVGAWIKIDGWVNAVPGFLELPAIMNPASEIVHEVFGPEVGAHARYVVGVVPPDLPVSKELPAASVLPMKLWIGLDERFDWKGKLYKDIPMRFRPSPLNLIFKDLTGSGSTLKAEEVRFQALDFDTL